jgi:hypothetical protein
VCQTFSHASIVEAGALKMINDILDAGNFSVDKRRSDVDDV